LGPALELGSEVFQYTGKLPDATTGLYYDGARYHNSTTGRFITEDSYNGTKTDPISQNKYIYGGDNPMRYVDPTGHYFLSAYRLYVVGAKSRLQGAQTCASPLPTAPARPSLGAF
jgi:RHS repeat-associated protein